MIADNFWSMLSSDWNIVNLALKKGLVVNVLYIAIDQT